MKRSRIVWMALAGLFLLTVLYWRFFYSGYIREMKTLPKEITSENYYQILEALSRLPNTQTLFSSSRRPAIKRGGGVVSTKWTHGGLEARLSFSAIKDFHDVEEKSARIFVVLPAPLDLSLSILMTRVQVRGNVILSGHLNSRLQFELYDLAGRVLRGPKMVAQKPGQDIPLVVRPTITDPVPTGFADSQFDVTKVGKVAIRFILGDPGSSPPVNFFGTLFLNEVIVVRNLDLIKRFFPAPNTSRVTEDRFNLGYELRKREWRKRDDKFFVGINYPWRNYGWDFGKNPWGTNPLRDGWALHEKELLDNFTRFHGIGVTHVRLYTFFDLRTGLTTLENGDYAMDNYVLEDAEAVFRAAGKAKVHLVLVLFDFGLGNTAVSEYDMKGRPELIFSTQKYAFLTQAMIPFLRKLDKLNDQYGKPVEYLELMNEPDNMALLTVPGYYDGLKSWLADIATIVHNETSMKVTLGSRSFPDFLRWWKDVAVDAYQFHFYTDMATDMPPAPFDTPRQSLGVDGDVFCGELDPYRMEANIPKLKERGYNGVLLWSFSGHDGFHVDLDSLKKITSEISKASPNKKPEIKEQNPPGP